MTLGDRIRDERIRRKLEVAFIEAKMKVKWFGYVQHMLRNVPIRKGEEIIVNGAMGSLN